MQRPFFHFFSNFFPAPSCLGGNREAKSKKKIVVEETRGRSQPYIRPLQASRKKWNGETHRCVMGSSSSHISGGHGDKAHYNREVLCGTKALNSNRMLPHCGYEGLSRRGLRQQSYPTRMRHHTEEVSVWALFSTASGPVSTVLRSQ